MSFYKREDPDPEDWTPHRSDHKVRTCRQCGVVLDDHGRLQFNGWFWCKPHYDEIVALYMNASGDTRELEGQERAARMDIDRDDCFETRHK